MEHILQFGITIDEQKIVDTATERAGREVIRKIENEVDNYTRGYESKLERIFKDEVKKVIEENKEQILKSAVDQLAYNLSRTKRAKELLDSIELGGNNE